MATIRVAGVQMVTSDKIDDNLPKILDHILHCSADIVLFPEMSLTGYHGNFDLDDVEDAWDRIASACRKAYVTAIVGTGARDEENKSYIQARIFGDDGEVVGTHEKLVPTEGDRRFCRPGEELRTFDHRGIRFGCLICNDMWVTPGCGPYPDPRLSYQLGKRGAQAIFHLINSGSSQEHIAYHESNLALRARESGIFIFTANAAKDSPVNARSGVVSPQGEWLVDVPREGEHVYTFDWDAETA